jgi:DNA-binding response OmpR family regulator
MKKTIHILLVDDDADDQELFMEALNEVDASINCIISSNGLDALKVLNDSLSLPDYIFLDLNMPRLNGKGFLTEVKKNKNLSSIPIIIYSTSKNEVDVRETKQLGASFFLTKPHKFSELRAAISLIIFGNVIGNTTAMSEVLMPLKEISADGEIINTRMPG